jgi:hypothetical protein
MFANLVQPLKIIEVIKSQAQLIGRMPTKKEPKDILEIIE